MMPPTPTRRGFLKSSAGVSLASAIFLGAEPAASAERSANERLQLGLIGAGWRPDIKRVGRGNAIGRQAAAIADVVAIAEVDSIAMDYAVEKVSQGRAKRYVDYRELLERDDIDAVLIASPDHWHHKMSIDAMRAGKDVYCEKPATVTIAEGRQMAGVVKETGRVLQVGTQQRTEIDHRFAKAIALIRDGRIGKVHTIRIGVDEGLKGGPFEKTSPPSTFNYDLWLGPAPEADYIKERTHWTFRWWFEYAGGKLTDWGAHHVDIAQWAIDQLHTGPTHVEGTGTFLQDLKNGYATRDDTYNTPVTFEVTCRFDNVPIHGTVNMVLHSGENGILFEGEKGRFFVNRGKLTGKPVEELKYNPLPENAIESLYQAVPFGGPPPASHVQHFVDCVKARATPISDMESHQRTITTCHLANLALRLGRPLNWDPQTERFPNDEEANTFLGREARAGFETT